MAEEHIERMLILSHCGFVGELKTSKFALNICFPNHRSPNVLRDPRNNLPINRGIIVTIDTSSIAKRVPGPIIHDNVATILSNCLSLLFGKCVWYAGPLQSVGIFFLPPSEYVAPVIDWNQPIYANAERESKAAKLNLCEARRLLPALFFDEEKESIAHTFFAMCKLYNNALLNYNRDPEISYLQLISAGEVLALTFNYDKLSLLDEQTKRILEEIESTLPHGKGKSNLVKQRLLQIKKSFIKAITELVEDDFFCLLHDELPGCMFTKDNLENAVAAGYDLRSKYLHTGLSFGRHVAGDWGLTGLDLVFPGLSIDGVRLTNELEHAPTLRGLERLIRYCLLALAEKRGLIHTNSGSEYLSDYAERFEGDFFK